MLRGFRLSLDLSSSAAVLTCVSCRGSHEVDGGEPDVVLAATTTTFLAAHQRCEQPVVA